jgi:hypothetical protein
MRLVFLFLEWLVIALVALIAVFEVAWPALRGRQVFPSFRREGRLREKLAEAAQRRHEAELEKLVKDFNRKKESGK